MPMRHLPAVLLVAWGLGVAGCGGDGGKSSGTGTKPDAWASEVCGALTDWVDGLQASSSTLAADLQETKDLKSVKAKFIVFVENAERSTATMAGKVEEVGQPAVDDGAAIQKELTDAFEQIRASFARALESAKELSTKNLQSFRRGVGVVSGAVQRQLTSAGAHFMGLDEKYDSPELKKAMDDEPDCDRFSQGS